MNPSETILMANIQGLLPRSNKSKISFLIELAKLEEYAMIALTESHLNNNINITEIGIENYTTFRADRDNRSHGGVITYIRNDRHKCQGTTDLLEWNSRNNSCAHQKMGNSPC